VASLADLVKHTAADLGISQRVAQVVIETFLDEVVEYLRREEPVWIKHFGSFYFTYQKFSRAYWERHGRIPDNVEDPRVKVCRFRLAKRLKDSLNGIVEDVGLDHTDLSRLNYKQRGLIGSIPQARIDKETEAERRARCGITLGEVVKRMNEEEAGRG